MQKLISEWERSAAKFEKLGRNCDDAVKREGLLCRSEVYHYCAHKLAEFLQQAVVPEAP